MTSDIVEKRKAEEAGVDSALDAKKSKVASTTATANGHGKGKAVDVGGDEGDEDEEGGPDYVEGQLDDDEEEELGEDGEEEDEEDEDEEEDPERDVEEGDEEEEEEDDMAEIDTSNVIQGRRTRGKQIDFEKVSREVDQEADSAGAEEA